MDFEVCIDSVEGALMASKYGAKRVELCAALSEGGLTPGLGIIESVVKHADSEVYVMIRPSAGGFVYTDVELELMQNDIKAVAGVGAHGVVFGVLNPTFGIDVKRNLYLMETALQANLGTTFHRAIDLCPNPLEALDHLIHLGFDRVLTSGGHPTAPQGIDPIRQMHAKANGQIEIMVGSGIRAENVQSFVDLKIDAIHFTAQRQIHEELPLDMGPKYAVDEKKIQDIVAALG